MANRWRLGSQSPYAGSGGWIDRMAHGYIPRLQVRRKKRAGARLPKTASPAEPLKMLCAYCGQATAPGPDLIKHIQACRRRPEAPIFREYRAMCNLEAAALLLVSALAFGGDYKSRTQEMVETLTELKRIREGDGHAQDTATSDHPGVSTVA